MQAGSTCGVPGGGWAQSLLPNEVSHGRKAFIWAVERWSPPSRTTPWCAALACRACCCPLCPGVCLLSATVVEVQIRVWLTLFVGHVGVPERLDAGAVRVSGLDGAVRDVPRNACCLAGTGRVRRNLSSGSNLVVFA